MREYWKNDVSHVNVELKPLPEDGMNRVLFKVLPKGTVYP